MADPDRRLAAAVRLHDDGRLAEAEAVLREIVREADAARRARPVDALVRLAGVLFDRGQTDRAYTVADEAAVLGPHNPFAHNLRAMALAALDRTAEAEAAFRAAIACDPGHAEMHHNLGRLLGTQRRPAEAARAYEAALALDPAMEPARRALVSAFRDAGRFADALAVLDQLIARIGESPSLLDQRGQLLYLLRRPAEALAVLDRAIAADPALDSARLRRAHALLLMGDFARGWPAHDHLFERPGLVPAPFERPRWTGEPLAGRTVVVWAEMGLGDAIQLVRFVPHLVARGARVVVLAMPPLVRLLASTPGVSRAATPGAAIGPHDFFIPTMALPAACGASLATLPVTVPYLAPDPATRSRWAERYPRKSRPRVGLVWAGESRPHVPVSNANDRLRNLALAALAPLLAVDGVDFVSLQLGEARAQLRGAPAWIDDPMDGVADLADTAAIMERLDLVVTVDTAAAHLAGALGRPGWVLLPKNGCWRWLMDREDSPWYPTLRLFRQGEQGDWSLPVARAAAALTDLARRAAARRT